MSKKGPRNLLTIAYTLSPSGFEVRTGFYHEGKTLTVSTEMFRNGRNVTTPQAEILCDWLPFFAALVVQHFAPALIKDPLKQRR
jgi:hypothetical protein